MAEDFKFNRKIGIAFQPAGSKKFIDLGTADKVEITETITVDGKTLTHTYEPGNQDSMKAATGRLLDLVKDS
jgi:hypothetical protein